MFRIQIEGKNHIPKKGGAILVANHQSNHDFLFVAVTTKRPISFLAKKELFKGPLKWILKSVQTIPVDRNKRNDEAIQKATKYLKMQKLICIFPEGTFNHTSELLAPFKKGSVRLAAMNNVPIIPITIKRDLKKRKVFVYIDKPMEVSKDALAETKKLRNKMIKNLRGKM